MSRRAALGALLVMVALAALAAAVSAADCTQLKVTVDDAGPTVGLGATLAIRGNITAGDGKEIPYGTDLAITPHDVDDRAAMEIWHENTVWFEIRVAFRDREGPVNFTITARDQAGNRCSPPAHVDVAVGPPVPHRLETRIEHAMDLSFSRGDEVLVRGLVVVLDSMGNEAGPAAGVRVWAVLCQGCESDSFGTTLTGADGSFELHPPLLNGTQHATFSVNARNDTTGLHANTVAVIMSVVHPLPSRPPGGGVQMAMGSPAVAVGLVCFAVAATLSMAWALWRRGRDQPRPVRPPPPPLRLL